MRNNKVCIWTSSYDRGLDHLLEIWPEVKKAVPEAELWITYGWELFNAVYGENGMQANPERQAWRDNVTKMMQQPGVKHLGRVGQKEMVKLLREAGIWAYPTNFDEISCISAMKAQVYGAIPVTMKRAALKETVKFGELVPGEITNPKVKETYTKFLIEWLKDTERQNTTRSLMTAEAAKLFSWKGVAEQFIDEFKSPKVYSVEWARQVFESLPKELQKDEYKSYRLS